MAQHFMHMPKVGAAIQNNDVCPMAKKSDATDNFCSGQLDVTLGEFR